jgi:hypothetical protein
MNAYIPFPIWVINVRTTLQPLRNCDRCCTTEVPGTILQPKSTPQKQLRHVYDLLILQVYRNMSSTVSSSTVASYGGYLYSTTSCTCTTKSMLQYFCNSNTTWYYSTSISYFGVVVVNGDPFRKCVKNQSKQLYSHCHCI